jgi:hypothetical protein
LPSSESLHILVSVPLRHSVGLLFLSLALTRGQEAPTGTIAGRVTDNVGGIPGATITASTANDRRTTSSDRDGRYQFVNLRPGSWALKVEADGFAPVVAPVTVQPGGTTDWSPLLKPRRTLTPDPANDMRLRVERLIGPKPLNCGRHLLVFSNGPSGRAPADESTLQRFVACAVESAQQRIPFWTFEQQLGIDGWVAQGLFGTPDGQIQRFSYDSAPCGNDSACLPRLTTERCNVPFVRIRDSMLQFACRP